MASAVEFMHKVKKAEGDIEILTEECAKLRELYESLKARLESLDAQIKTTEKIDRGTLSLKNRKTEPVTEPQP
jgi:predicted RNase H-like nuclease (RuvC/YqgF family)